jgi:hypothetical protein
MNFNLGSCTVCLMTHFLVLFSTSISKTEERNILKDQANEEAS